MTGSSSTGSIAVSPAHARLRELLYAALAGRSEPVLFVGEHVVPAASVWSGARTWVSAFRSAGVTAGDRVLVATGPCASTAEVVVACLWQGCTAVIADSKQADGFASKFGCDLAVAHERCDMLPTWQPEGLGRIRQPCPQPTLQESRHPGQALADRSGGMRFDELLELLTDPVFAPVCGARAISIQPWTDTKALVFDVLVPLVRGAAVVVHVPSGMDGPERLMALLDEAAWCCVPKQVTDMLAYWPKLASALGRARGWVVVHPTETVVLGR